MSGTAKALSSSILLVSGAPGSGKTTIARELAHMLRYPLLSKDTIKESLFDSLGDALGLRLAPAAVSRLLSDAAMDALWSLAPMCPQVILEANFRPKSDSERDRIEALAGRKLEIYCHCTAAEASRRFAARATRPEHHPAHSMKTFSLGLLTEYDRPIGLCPVIDVDTEIPVNGLDIVRKIQGHWPDASVLDREPMPPHK